MRYLLSIFCLWRQRRAIARAEALFRRAHDARDRATIWMHRDSLVRGLDGWRDYRGSVAGAKKEIGRRRRQGAKRLAHKLLLVVE